MIQQFEKRQPGEERKKWRMSAIKMVENVLNHLDPIVLRLRGVAEMSLTLAITSPYIVHHNNNNKYGHKKGAHIYISTDRPNCVVYFQK